MNIQDAFFGQIRQCSLSDLRYIKHSLEGLWGLCRAVQRTLNVWWGCGVVGLWGFWGLGSRYTLWWWGPSSKLLAQPRNPR